MIFLALTTFVRHVSAFRYFDASCAAAAQRRFQRIRPGLLSNRKTPGFLPLVRPAPRAAGLRVRPAPRASGLPVRPAPHVPGVTTSRSTTRAANSAAADPPAVWVTRPSRICLSIGAQLHHYNHTVRKLRGAYICIFCSIDRGNVRKVLIHLQTRVRVITERCCKCSREKDFFPTPIAACILPH